MSKRSLIVFTSVLVSLAVIPFLLILYGFPPLVSQESIALEYESYGVGRYQIEAKYPSLAISNSIKVRLTIKGPSDEIVEFYGWGDAMKISMNQTTTILYENTFQKLSFNNEGIANFIISFDSGALQLGSHNFTITVNIGEFVSDGRVSYRTYQNNLEILIIPIWLYAVCLISGTIIGVILKYLLEKI